LKAPLAVVIVSYNTALLLRRCLSSLTLSLTRYPVEGTEIVVVDNGSADGSPAMVEAEFPQVRLLAVAENRGFAAANNLALREVDANFVLFLNPDTEVLGDAPAALLRFLASRSTGGLCGGRLLNPDLSFQQCCFRFPTLAMSVIDFFPINHRIVNSRLNGRYPRKWYNRPFPIDHPLGACMLVREEVIQRVGGFDEGYFMYCEEVDWCRRIREAGWAIYYTPDAEIIHHQAASTRQNASAMLAQLHRSRDRFFQKHYGPIFTQAARLIVRFGMRAAARQARADFQAGRLTEREYCRQLELHRQVVQWQR
jgi:GT2 family glycosyltransferase